MLPSDWSTKNLSIYLFHSKIKKVGQVGMLGLCTTSFHLIGFMLYYSTWLLWSIFPLSHLAGPHMQYFTTSWPSSRLITPPWWILEWEVPGWRKLRVTSSHHVPASAAALKSPMAASNSSSLIPGFPKQILRSFPLWARNVWDGSTYWRL